MQSRERESRWVEESRQRERVLEQMHETCENPESGESG